MNKCANCGGEIDSEWPGNKGPYLSDVLGKGMQR